MRNQCDGCMRKLPIENGIHREPNGHGYIGCSAHLYGGRDTKLVAFTVQANGCKGSIFLEVPRTADGRVVLSGEAFNRAVEKALGYVPERGTTISHG